MEKHAETDYKITWRVESTQTVEVIIVLLSVILLKKKNCSQMPTAAVFMRTAGKKRKRAGRVCINGCARVHQAWRDIRAFKDEPLWFLPHGWYFQGHLKARGCPEGWGRMGAGLPKGARLRNSQPGSSPFVCWMKLQHSELSVLQMSRL